MSNDTFIQPEEQTNAFFVDHCSHLDFANSNSKMHIQDEFVGHVGLKYVDLNGNSVISGPGNCHNSMHQI